ncbi:hypothetical protein BGX21_000494 [Mortierella sp. AD011]|nr:hypothetical protein BGX20_007588 [Mortierella sp. AD010]KAF9387671.1 hypothetical protein BGX21_000494 [Mortierella sp. AD011]
MLGSLFNSLFSESTLPAALRHGVVAVMPLALATFKTIITCSFVVLLCYMALVRKRRYQGINRMLKKYPDPTLPLRDLEVANEVWSFVSDCEFPFTFNFTVQMMLLKLSGIPSISKIVISTKQTTNHGVKRANDTTLLIAEALQSYSRRTARSLLVDKVDPVTGTITTTPRKKPSGASADIVDDEELKERTNDDARAKAAVDRINFIHSHYNISQGDFVYNLALSVLDSIYWVGRFDWRPLTELEENALVAIWTDLGRKMGIENIPKTVQEFEDWAENYELGIMKYAPTNTAMADGNIAVSQSLVTTPEAKARVKKFFVAIMNPRSRAAVGYDEPTRTQVFVSRSILWVRGCIVKYLMMPRTAPHLLTAMRATKFEDVSIKNNNVENKETAGGCPFSGGMRYVPRFNDLGPLYPRGYKIEELGPEKFFGKGLVLS